MGNVFVDKSVGDARERTTNMLFGLGAVLWSVPLTAIQALATAKSVGN